MISYLYEKLADQIEVQKSYAPLLLIRTAMVGMCSHIIQ